MRGHRAISLFSGVGGLDCGLRAAGIEVVASSDADPRCAESLRANSVGDVLETDIKDLSATKLLAAAGAKVGEIDLLTAGPPCQPFSKSANWHNGVPRGLADPRAGTLQHLIRLIEGTLPRVVLVENVPGFSVEGMVLLDKAVQKINEAHSLKYKLSHAFLDAANYGVPQFRRRLMMVWDSEGRTFKMPPPTHGTEERPYVTAWDAIGGLALPQEEGSLQAKGRWADLLPSIPEGANYLWHTDRGGGLPLFGWRRRYWTFLLKLAKKRPSWTLPANPAQNSGPFHWDNRMLSTQELARLQTLPDGWGVRGERADRVRQIGNAVPALMAEVIARAICRQLLGDEDQGAPKLFVPARSKVPARRPRRRVPEKYLSLAGTHKPHPGKGLGPGAKRRKRRLQTSKRV